MPPALKFVTTIMIVLAVIDAATITRLYLGDLVNLSAHRSIGAVIGFCLNSLIVICAVNLRQLIGWSRKLAIGLLALYSLILSFMALGFFYALIRYFRFSAGMFFKTLEFVVYLSIIFYLLHPNVRKHFLKGK